MLQNIEVEPEDIKPQLTDNKPSEDEIIDMLVELRVNINGLSTTQIRQLLEYANYDKDKVLEKYELSKKKENIKDLMAWLVSAIKEDFKSPYVDENKKPKNKFNDFNQRNYTKEEIDELEKHLLTK